MEILITAKLYLRMFGILPIPQRNLPSVIRNCSPKINLIHIVLTSGCLLLYLSSLGHFLIFRVKSPIAFFQSVFFFTLTLMRVSLYFLILFEKSKLSALMDDLAEVVGKSKLKLFLRSESKFITFKWWIKP